MTWQHQAKRNPSITQPMIDVRTVLINAICGARYWMEVREWRLSQFGEFSHIVEILTYADQKEVMLGDFLARHEALQAERERAAVLEPLQAATLDSADARLEYLLNDNDAALEP